MHWGTFGTFWSYFHKILVNLLTSAVAAILLRQQKKRFVENL
jgi:hypothetical protein